MTEAVNVHAIVDQIVAESNASDRELAKRDDVTGIVARLRIAVCGALLHAIADEGEMGTDPRTFAEAGECFLATVAASLAGYLGGDARHVQPNAARMLYGAAEVALQVPDDSHGGVPVPRVERGTKQ